jgi:hypothetical protein
MWAQDLQNDQSCVGASMIQQRRTPFRSIEFCLIVLPRVHGKTNVARKKGEREGDCKAQEFEIALALENVFNTA